MSEEITTPEVVETEAAAPVVEADDLGLGDLSAEELELEPVAEGTETGTVEPEPVVEDPFAAYGGKENLDSAHKMWEAAQSDEGVTRLFLEAGRSLGLGLAQMEALFGAGAGEPEAEAAEEEDPDRLLTAREVQEMLLARDAKKTETAQAEQTKVAQGAVADTLSTLGLDPADSATAIILQFGDKHLTDMTPEGIKAAITQGHADFEAMIQAEAKKYVTAKVTQRKTVPKSPGGVAAPATEAPVEPKDVDEAILRVRKKMGF